VFGEVLKRTRLAIAFCAVMQVQAHVENGVLKVVIGKTAEPQRKRQAVKVT
jgi:HSP20 family molecular chaperone IbpA